jgi:hypothetical protein
MVKSAAILLVLVLLLAGNVSVGQAQQGVNDSARNRDHAVTSYAALRRYFYQPDAHLYRETYPQVTGNPYSYHWPFSQAVAATVDMAKLPQIGGQYYDSMRDRLVGLERYWNTTTTPPGYDSYVRPLLGGGGDKFYDDNEWAGLELVRIYQMTGDRAALQRAQQVFDLVVSGWDRDPTHPAPGGVFWTQSPGIRTRGTVSNAPAAELGMHLYTLTGRSYYLEWSKQIYDWTNRSLLAPNGLYWDNIDLNGTIEKTQWSYNQGTMIGASVLLYRATGNPAYLAQAERIADAALALYGVNDRYFTQHPAFNAIFFKNLLLLDAVRSKPAYRQAMQAYADAVWDRVRDPNTDLFVFVPDQPATLLENAAIVQIYATLAQPVYDKVILLPIVAR